MTRKPYTKSEKFLQAQKAKGERLKELLKQAKEAPIEDFEEEVVDMNEEAQEIYQEEHKEEIQKQAENEKIINGLLEKISLLEKKEEEREIKRQEKEKIKQERQSERQLKKLERLKRIEERENTLQELKNDYIIRNQRKMNLNGLIDLKKSIISQACKF